MQTLSGKSLAPLTAVVLSALMLPASGPAAAIVGRMPQRTITFSRYTWRVKSSTGLVGPGPNYFSNSVKNVWVDSRGRLHLKLTSVTGRWYCAEVVNTKSLGRGRYSFELGSPVHALDANIVLGLFTWSTNPAYNHREIDIEFARFGNAADPTNGDFVVQPYSHKGNLQRFTQPAISPSTHSFNWRPRTVRFASSTATPSTWTYSGPDVPPPGSEHVHINLWLYRGSPPTNGRRVEIVINRFTFTRTH